jgi:hypothetical protein
MVNNFTNIKKKTNKQPPHTSIKALNTNKNTIYGVGNPSPDLGQAQK